MKACGITGRGGDTALLNPPSWRIVSEGDGDSVRRREGSIRLTAATATTWAVINTDLGVVIGDRCSSSSDNNSDPTLSHSGGEGELRNYSTTVAQSAGRDERIMHI